MIANSAMAIFSYLSGMTRDKQIAAQGEIIERYGNGEEISYILRSIGIKYSTYRTWRKNNPEFDGEIRAAQEAYTEAKLARLAEALDLYPNPQAAKVFSDNTRWILSKTDPARFGDRIDVNHQHSIDLTDAYNKALNRLKEAQALPECDQRNVIDAQPIGNTRQFAVMPPDNISDSDTD